MKIDHVDHGNKAHDLKEKAKVEEAKDATPAKETSGGKSKTDTVIISEQARSMQRTEAEMKAWKSRLQSDPGLREDKVVAAKTKVDSGKLLGDGVVERTAEAIMKSGSLADIVKGKELMARLVGQEDDVSGSRQSKLAEVRQKMESGFYDSQEVTEHVAGKIIEDLLA